VVRRTERTQVSVGDLRMLPQLEQLECVSLKLGDVDRTPPQRGSRGIEQAQGCLHQQLRGIAAESEVDDRCERRREHHDHPEPQHEPRQNFGRPKWIDQCLT
jgi:hypothetical protein